MVVGTIVANVTAKLKILEQICSKLTIRIVFQFVS